ncbi:MAG: class I SAM-dependent methyltransferase [Candidatus Erginobacter occultus]|nr:class I SAM-dependent methyltransferase [Candidatus Erginobacter occultus]
MGKIRSGGEVSLIERQYWDARRHRDPVDDVTLDYVREQVLRPFYEGGSDKYTCNKIAFHGILNRCWEKKHVLDYACGDGFWAVYFALTGAGKVSGFDLSPVGIERGRERVTRQGLDSIVDLRTMDARRLEYPDNCFDLVIGHGAIHHTIKYPNVFAELHRVMKPGTSAFFLENLADFRPWRWHWKIKGPIAEGDVPIFTRELREKASMFAEMNITGDTLLYSIKMFWKRQPGPVGRWLLRLAKKSDDFLFRRFPSLRNCGSFSYIELKKGDQ